MATKKKKKLKRCEANKGVGCLTPMEQRKHTARDNRERAFALEYLRTLSATKAGMAIGLSEKTLRQASWTYLRRPGVQKIIQEELSKRTDAAGVTAEWIINRLRILAGASMKDFAAWDGHDVALVGSETATRDQAAPIKEVKSVTTATGGINVSIKLHDTVKALELLAKIKGLLGTDGKGGFGGSDAREMAAQVRDELSGFEQTVPTVPTKEDDDGEGA